MESNLYRPPGARIDVPPPPPGSVAQPPFHVVARGKFRLLFFSTFGLYTLYWWYRNWVLQRDVDRVDCIPPLRALFPVFFTHALFANLARKLARPRDLLGVEPGTLATLHVAATVIHNISSRFVDGSLPLSLLVLASLVVAGITLEMAQRGINHACGDPDGASNSRLTGANIAWILVGGVLVLLNLAGMFLAGDV